MDSISTKLMGKSALLMFEKTRMLHSFTKCCVLEDRFLPCSKPTRLRRTRRYRYPEFDTTRRWLKVPSQELIDMLVAPFMEDREETK